MADFTINSLTASSFGSGDVMLKSNSAGALTKITKAQMKADLLEDINADYSKKVSGVRYTTISTDQLNSAVNATRTGQNITLEIYGKKFVGAHDTSEFTLFDSIPTGYAPGGLSTNSVIMHRHEDAWYPMACRAVNGKVYAYTSCSSGISADDSVMGTIYFNTSDALPV